MIALDDARWILAALDAATIARLTWRAAVTKDGEAQNAAAVLSLETGRVDIRSWNRSHSVMRGVRSVVLAETPATGREDIEDGARRGAEVPPSDEVIEEGVVRAAAQEGLGVIGIERQLRRAYEVLGEGAA